MAIRAKVNISSPRGTCIADQIPRNFQPAFLRQCVAGNLTYDDGSDEQDEPELAVGDILDSWNRQALIQVIAINNLPIQVMKKWTEGQIRQAIRDLVPVDERHALKTGPARVSEVDMSTGITR